MEARTKELGVDIVISAAVTERLDPGGGQPPVDAAIQGKTGALRGVRARCVA